MINSVEIQQGITTIRVIAEAIKEAKRIPSGTLYSLLMGKMSLQTYEKVIEILTKTGMVENKNHELIWKEQS